MKPRILIDARMVSRFEHGISRYVTSIATGLREKLKKESLDYEPVFLLDRNENLESVFPWNELTTVSTSVRFLSWREWFEIPRLIEEHRIKAFHTPSFASFPGIRVPYVQTIHDLNHLFYGSLAKKVYYHLFLKPFALKAAVRASVSESARREIANWLGVEPSTIEVHPNTFEGVSVSPEDLKLEKDWLRAVGLEPYEYFLAVANEKPHKNLKLLREAHAQSEASIPLVVAHEFLSRNDPDRSNPYAMSALYRYARSVFSPSLYEGFGRVPVEALLHGAPVFVSDIPPHREVLIGGRDRAGVYFVDPRDLNAWRDVFRAAFLKRPDAPSADTQKELLERYSPVVLTELVHAAYLRVIQ